MVRVCGYPCGLATDKGWFDGQAMTALAMGLLAERYRAREQRAAAA